MVISLANLATQFLEREKPSQNTIYSYETTLLPLLQRHGRSQITDLTRTLLEEYLNSLTHLSDNTHNRHRVTIQALFNFAIEQGYLESNPMAHLKRRKSDKGENEGQNHELIRYLAPAQLETLYNLVENNSRLHTLILLLHHTGANVSEILALDLDQINFRDRRFQVIDNHHQGRWCDYGEDLARVLENYLRLYRHSGHPALLTAQQPFSKTVSRLSYRTAYRDWINLMSQSPDLKGYRLHDLRHTFAIERVGLIGVEELKALMGHENIQTTFRYYKLFRDRVEAVSEEE